MGLYLHFKLQENEIDDNRRGDKREQGLVPESLDGGKLGPERKLYCRELIARFAHNLALNWNIGEENTQSTEEVVDMVRYLHDTDPYKHHIVIHTFPGDQDKVYTPLLGDKSLLTGALAAERLEPDTPADAQVGDRVRQGRPALGRRQRRAGPRQSGRAAGPRLPGPQRHRRPGQRAPTTCTTSARPRSGAT